MVPVVAFVGMPGVGKSTVLAQVADRLVPTWTPVGWSIDDVLEIQCPEGTAEFAGCRLYVRDGAHFLMHDEWRPDQMRRATRGLVALARASARPALFPRPPVLLLELPLTELATFRAAVAGQPDLTGLVAILRGSRSVRWSRNAQRGERQRLPEPVLEYFEQALRSVDVVGECAMMRAAGWRVVNQRTSQPPAVLAERLADIVRSMLAPGPGD
ncbi:ATP-binding protein [Micromonospora sp. NPDC001898]|uniref:ATP-binding protein n=1 Tax=Micromonospora sp. NPDC001898 TaxID=3364221 RepID=UPI0036985703